MELATQIDIFKRELKIFQNRFDFLKAHVISFPMVYWSWLSVMDKVWKNCVEREKDENTEINFFKNARNKVWENIWDFFKQKGFFK